MTTVSDTVSMISCKNRIALVLSALVGVGTIGCYGYYQPEASNLAGHQIQLAITDSGSAVLAPQVGYSVEAVDGKLIADTAARYVLSVSGIRRRDGYESSWKGEPLSIPHSFVATLMERRFSRARTVLFATATTIAMVAVKHAFGGSGSASAPGGTQGGTGPR